MPWTRCAIPASPESGFFGGPLAQSKVHWARPGVITEITYLTWFSERGSLMAKPTTAIGVASILV